MKSLVQVAPLLPPPPYTSLMTSPVPAGLAPAPAGTRRSELATRAKTEAGPTRRFQELSMSDVSRPGFDAGSGKRHRIAQGGTSRSPLRAARDSGEAMRDAGCVRPRSETQET